MHEVRLIVWKCMVGLYESHMMHDVVLISQIDYAYKLIELDEFSLLCRKLPHGKT